MWAQGGRRYLSYLLEHFGVNNKGTHREGKKKKRKTPLILEHQNINSKRLEKFINNPKDEQNNNLMKIANQEIRRKSGPQDSLSLSFSIPTHRLVKLGNQIMQSIVLGHKEYIK